MKQTDNFEEELFLEWNGQGELLKYYLANNITDIENIINQNVVNDISDLQNADWEINTALSPKVIDMMNKHKVNYSLTIYNSDLGENIKTVVINQRSGDKWLFYSGEIIEKRFYSSYREFKETEENDLLKDVIHRTDIDEARQAYNTGSTYLHRKNFDEAEKYFLMAIDLDPNYVDAMDHLGLVYRNQGRYKDAEYIYLKSISINSDNMVPYQNLAVVYSTEGRFKDACEIYFKMMTINENDPEPYYGIARLYSLNKMYKESIKYYDIAIQKYKNIHSVLIYDAYLFQGLNYYYLGDYITAGKYLVASLPKHSNNKMVINVLENIEQHLRGNF